MRKRFLVLAVLLLGAGLTTLGCRGGPGGPPVAGTGSVTVLGTDAALCDVLSFTVTIASATLTPQGGGMLATVISSTPVTIISSQDPVTVDFAALKEFSTVLNLATAPADTYTKLTVTFSNPQLTILDVTKSPPAPVTITTNLTSLTVSMDLNPPLTITSSGSVSLTIDFNLRKSVQLDALGQVTGTVNPVVQVTSQTTETERGFDEIMGLVQNVTTTSADNSFTGSFDVQVRSGQKFTVHVNTNTVLKNVGLGALMNGTFVKVSGFIDAMGNLVARKVEAEETELGQMAAFVGVVTSVGSRDPAGNVTQFDMFIREEDPDESACVQPKSLLLVNVATPTKFDLEEKEANQGLLTFDATTLGPGQELVVHGQCQPGVTPRVNVTSIFLRLQTFVGDFSKLLAAALDGKAGGFEFVPCGTAFHGKPVTVFTFTNTAFKGVTDLKSLSAQFPKSGLAVKGLLLYDQQAVTVNTISVTPPAAVMEAVEVHQIE